MAHGAQLLSETRLMVNFQKEDERYGGPIRYLGSRAIFLYPNVPRGRDLDFPYTNLRLLFVLHVQGFVLGGDRKRAKPKTSLLTVARSAQNSCVPRHDGSHTMHILPN